MALRVLLADESSTIKKVMQLALADFGVEVKAVPVGLDVLAVAKSFNPDIIFADVLLAKKNGYEVSAEIKDDSETANIPVVLMWSSFMEVDEAKISRSGANGRLEKPFDAEQLRNLVNNLVQKTTTNPVSSFLTFPEMPNFEETPAEMSTPGNADDIYAIPDEEFAAVPLTSQKSEEEHDEGGWSHQDLSKFKINIPETENTDFASKFVIPQDEELASAHFEVSGNFEEVSFQEEPQDLTVKKAPAASAAPSAAKPNTLAKTQSQGDMKADMMEKIIREEAREVIEAICWKILPEIAERIVREEINKILRDTDKSI